MTTRTIKEFAEALKIDKKVIQNKITYEQKKSQTVFRHFSDGVRYLTEDEQDNLCELLGLEKLRRFSDGFQSQVLTSKNELEIKILTSQIDDLKQDKKDLKNQLEQTYLEKKELLKANDELRILLQNSLEQTNQIQTVITDKLMLDKKSSETAPTNYDFLAKSNNQTKDKPTLKQAYQNWKQKRSKRKND